MTPLRVTVLAVCYNHARFVLECLESISKQTYQDFELIVIDDCSKDNSQELIQEWIQANRPSAKFIRHTVNRGVCATLNEGLALATGDLLALIATDDRWLPQKIEVQLARIGQEPPSTAVIYSDAYVMDELGQRTGATFIAEYRQGMNPPSGNIFGKLADSNFIPSLSTLIRIDALRKVGGYDESLTYEDYDMWLRLSGHGYNFVFLPEVVSEYRVVSTSLARTIFDSPSAKHSLTVLRIHDRWLFSGLLTDQQQKSWLKKMAQAAYSLFVHEHPDASQWLWKAAVRQKSLRFAMLSLVSKLGLRRRSLLKLVGRE